MKRFAICFLSVCLVLNFLFGCTSCVKQPKIEKVSISEIFSDEQSVLKREYENMKLPEAITLDQPSQLVTYKTKSYESVSDKEKKTALQNFVTTFYDYFDEADIHLWADGVPFYYYENEDIYVTCDANYDSFCFSKNGYDWVYNLKKEAVFHVDRNDSIENISYLLNGKDYKLTDAKAYADSLVKDTILQFTNYKDARLKKIYVCKSDGSDYHYALEYEFLVNGIPVDVSGDSHGDKAFMLSPTLLIEMAEPDEFFLVRSERCFSFETPTVLKESFVSLSTALELAEQYLAGEHTYYVSDIELQYSCIANWKTSPYIYKPYWRIVLQEEESGIGSINLMPQISMYIDVQTGKICVYDTISGNLDSFPEGS
jgi:hypothetical protein